MAWASFSLSSLGLLTNIASYHLLLYGTLLGTEFYHVILSATKLSTIQTNCNLELCDDQNLLQSLTHVRLYKSAKTRIFFLFLASISSHHFHRSKLSIIWSNIAYFSGWRSDPDDHSRGHGGLESGSLGATNAESHD